MPTSKTTDDNEPREASGLTTRLILAYVESEGGRAAVLAVLERCGLEDREAELCDENAWFPDLTRVRLLEAAAEVLDDPLAARHVGESGLDLNVAQGLKVALRALGSPRLLYKNVARANAKFNRAHEMKLLELGETHARIENKPRAGATYHPCDCDYNIGLLSQAPSLFGEPPARISHTQCIGRGADACVFEIEWTNPRQRARRLVALGAAGVAALTGAALAAPWLLPALVAAIAATAIVMVVVAAAAARRRNLSLEREVAQQRDATGRLMASLEDLVSALRLEDVLDKITHNAQAAVGGTQFALLLEDGSGIRCQSSSGLPPDVTSALERWAVDSATLAEEPVLLDHFEEGGPLGALRDHPVMPLGSLCAAPLVYRGRTLGALVALAGGREGFLPRDVVLLQSYASQAAVALTNARLYEAQQALASRDSLTGLLNHREFHETVAHELERCRRYGGALSVVLLDLDEFKLVNDQSGHAEGDRVLRAAARELQTACRATDRAFRVGGDELALVLPETSLEGAMPVAERARERLSPVDPRISVSYGIASWPDSGPSKDALLARADADLYAMKRGKRSQAEREAQAPSEPHRERHGRQLEAASRLAAKLAPLLDTGAVARSAVEHLHHALAYPAAVINHLHPDGVLKPIAVAGPLAARLSDVESWAQRADQGIIGRAALRGEPVLVHDTRRDPDFIPADERLESRSELATPIRVEGQVWGVLNLEHTEVGAFDLHDVIFADMVASEVGAAIHRVKLFGELESTFMSTIAVLSDALEAKDAYTAEHARKVADLAQRVGTRLGLTAEEARTVRYAALLHDIGKIGIGGEIIRKQGPLSPSEFDEMKRHPVIGAQMLERIPFFASVHPIVRSSHERWDGRGYPDGLREEQIPLGARIINACDALDAMTSERPYREALPVETAIAEVRGQAGGQFDPKVVEALIAIVDGGRTVMGTEAAKAS